MNTGRTSDGHWSSFAWRDRPTFRALALTAFAAVGACFPGIGLAQTEAPPDVHYPLDQRTPPGVAAQWSAIAGRATPRYFQPIRVSLPSQGRVVVFAGEANQPVAQDAPAQFGGLVGQVYRLRISHMPEFPGVELYPSVEIVDRLHPPPGEAERFPIPVEFFFEELEAVLADRMVTKVVYLEQPQLAAPLEMEQILAGVTVPARRNLLAEADLRGRPMAIIRLGGRLPDVHRPDSTFFGSRAPIVLSKPSARPNDLQQQPPPAVSTPQLSVP